MGRTEFRKATALLAVSNFAASFGGGGLLAKGLTSLAAVPGFRGDSMLAYLVGTSLSLVGILGCRMAMRRAGGFISLAGAGIAVGLALTFEPLAHAGATGAWSAFALLCVNFSLIFIPRTLRADVVATESYQLPWLELSYGAGYLVSLLVWRFFPTVSFSTSLLVAALMLTVSAALDFLCARTRPGGKDTSPAPARTAAISAAPDSRETGIVGLIVALSVTTVAVQVGIQRLCTATADSLPLIAFEIGIIAAPLVAIFARMTLAFREAGSPFALRLSFSDGRRTGPTLASSVLGLLGAMLATLVGARLWGTGSPFVFVALCLASATYELVAILLLEAIGRFARRPGRVATAFGVMGLTATCAYAAFLYLDTGLGELIRLNGALLLAGILALAVDRYRHGLANDGGSRGTIEA